MVFDLDATGKHLHLLLATTPNFPTSLIHGWSLSGDIPAYDQNHSCSLASWSNARWPQIKLIGALNKFSSKAEGVMASSESR
jgi:hypothetical protein